jgi:hypothetical protein
MREKGEPGFPLHPLGGGAIPCPRGGAIPWASACDFLGSPCPRRQIQGWCLEGGEEVFEENDVYDVFDEAEDNDEFEDFVEHLDNQQW